MTDADSPPAGSPRAARPRTPDVPKHSSWPWVVFAVVATVVATAATYFAATFEPVDYLDELLADECESNLATLWVALEAYRAEHGDWPPVVQYDESGRPLHSWRALLLPHLVDDVGHIEYRFDEPFDSPHNRSLASRIPEALYCPADPDAIRYGRTSYLAVVDAEGGWGAAGRIRADQSLPDDKAAIWLVEVVDSEINWLEPRDVAADQLGSTLRAKASGAPASGHLSGAHVLLSDGTIARLDRQGRVVKLDETFSDL